MHPDVDTFEAVLGHYAALVERYLRSGMQMTPRQYARIASVIGKRSPCHVLVFGCGLDSPLWRELNRGGTCVFLEDVPRWARAAREQGIKVVDVHYQSRLHDWMHAPRPPVGFTEELLATKWDIVLVDAPLGVGECPGREQSIFTAAVLRERCDPVVFVHDYTRPWERACCDKYLGRPTAILDQNLAIWHVGGAAEA